MELRRLISFLEQERMRGGILIISQRVILLDLKMPKINGIEVLEKIKSDERTKYIPVVVLTSSAEDPDIKACYRLGVNSYIVKPLEFDAFTNKISELWSLLVSYE